MQHPRAKAKRHLAIAASLEKKGRFESAIVAADKARQLDPNSIDAALLIGQLFCRTGQGQKALDAVETLRTTRRLDAAEVLLISGWAKRLLGDLESAEKLILQAVQMYPKSSRAFYELGKIYRATGQTEKAMRAFYQALSLVFDEDIRINTSDFFH